MAETITALATNGFPTLADVCESPDNFLGKLDIGALNLMCAVGLPGAEDLDIAKRVAWLDEAADQVDLQIRERFDKFVQCPTAYNNSFGAFCCNYLLRTLQELFGVQYNPRRITDSDFQNPLCLNPDFRDSRDLFLHGIMNGPGGTCASMPVMYVAVGRRLGYPLRLVEAPGHLFFRWEDPEGKLFNVPERFNIEGTGSGMSFYPDEFYQTWPVSEWRPIDKIGGWYLKSLTPVEEFANFLMTRGSCLEDNGRTKEAIQVYEWATKLVPNDLRYATILVQMLQRDLREGHQALESERRMFDTERLVAELQQRRLNTSEFGDPRHGSPCQCLQCRQSRPLVHQSPGHPPGCPCPSCKTNPWRKD